MDSEGDSWLSDRRTNVMMNVERHKEDCEKMKIYGVFTSV